ncbi:MAG TPA: CAP domain-containing protein [Casimicrobiaceae bacterium]|nr:CAP domain-containing protein [Casimicrobiaceae bacterium]
MISLTTLCRIIIACSRCDGKWLVTIALALLATSHAAAAAPPDADPYAAQLGKLINDYRAQHDVPPLALDAPLSELAHEHAARMAADKRLSHYGFEERFAKAGSPRCVENVGWNQRTPEAEFAGWRDSPTHAKNLLDPGITRMGIGIQHRYVAFFACR